MAIKYYNEVFQGSDQWLDLRRGILTASEMKLIITPTLKIADNDKTRSHLYELAAQRISGYTEPHYISDSMLRGQEDEIYAREAYEKNYGPVTTMGFITNDKWGFTIGYSPDFLVGVDGQGEAKSRLQKFQVETIINDEMPADFAIQIQTGLLVTEREFCEFISYSGGLPVYVKRIFPDKVMQAAIVVAAQDFYGKLNSKVGQYYERLGAMPKVIETERVIREEIFI